MCLVDIYFFLLAGLVDSYPDYITSPMVALFASSQLSRLLCLPGLLCSPSQTHTHLYTFSSHFLFFLFFFPFRSSSVIFASDDRQPRRGATPRTNRRKNRVVKIAIIVSCYVLYIFFHWGHRYLWYLQIKLEICVVTLISSLFLLLVLFIVVFLLLLLLSFSRANVLSFSLRLSFRFSLYTWIPSSHQSED